MVSQRPLEPLFQVRVLVREPQSATDPQNWKRFPIVTDQSDISREPISVAVAILAAGNGKRMKSATAKHVHPVGGVPIVQRIIRAGQAINPDHIIVVVSPAMVDLPEQLGMSGEFMTAVMEEPTGTAHAVLAAIEALPEVDYIISLLGDSPLLTGETVHKLYEHAVASDSKLTLLTCTLDDAATYGRIERIGTNVTAIIEHKNDDAAKRVGRTEINSGIMVLQRDWALDALRRLPIDEGTGEYLLTDLVTMAVSEIAEGDAWPVDTVPGPEEVSVGINTRQQQAHADSILRTMVRKRHMCAGVSMVGPETIFIDETVTIGQDTMLLPGTILLGNTTIGSNCEIGPYAVLIDATIEDGVTVRASTIESSTLRHSSDAGPYAHIRGGSDIGENVHIGNFAELKNTSMARDSKSGHFSYLGDSSIGERTNIGAGAITANFDGTRKNHTEIGDDVFIGSDTVLVAPVEIEAGAKTGAGSVVTRNVAAGQTVVGVPARPMRSKPDAEKE